MLTAGLLLGLALLPLAEPVSCAGLALLFSCFTAALLDFEAHRRPRFNPLTGLLCLPAVHACVATAVACCGPGC